MSNLIQPSNHMILILRDISIASIHYTVGINQKKEIKSRAFNLEFESNVNDKYTKNQQNHSLILTYPK